MDRALRKESAERTIEIGFSGYAIGGLSVGEPIDLMYDLVGGTTPRLPADRPRYLMGAGTPTDLAPCIDRRNVRIRRDVRVDRRSLRRPDGDRRDVHRIDPQRRWLLPTRVAADGRRWWRTDVVRVEPGRRRRRGDFDRRREPGKRGERHLQVW